MKDYRIEIEKATGSEPWEVVHAVFERVADDAPSLGNSEEIELFFANIDPVIAATYSAWACAGIAANGGPSAIFDTFAPEVIRRAITGFELMGEPQASRYISERCKLFPEGEIPEELGEIEFYLDVGRPEIQTLLGRKDLDFYGKKNIAQFFDYEFLLRNGYTSFVRPMAAPGCL